jgi:hypothetical protein
MPPSPSKRKRHSAFDDFPVDKDQPVDTPRKVSLSNSSQHSEAKPEMEIERIERLKPSQMIPDRFQPRRLLPTALREPFFSGEMDCYQAAEQWLSLARQDSAHRAIIDRLLSMAASFNDHGQIKPITGSWADTQDGRYVFLIETGERRFWAACLQAASSPSSQEPLLRVEVVKHPSRQRQVLENRHAEMPSAVSQACEIAALILSETGIQPNPEQKDEYEYFRNARAQRMPAGLWEEIKPVMQLTRPRMVQLLNILQFPTALLEMADRYRLPERVLREVLSLPADQWERAILLSIQNQLTSDEVVKTVSSTEITSISSNPPVSTDSKPKRPPSLIAASGLRRFANTLLRLEGLNQAQAFDELADELVLAGDAESILVLLDELSMLINARLNRR